MSNNYRLKFIIPSVSIVSISALLIYINYNNSQNLLRKWLKAFKNDKKQVNQHKDDKSCDCLNSCCDSNYQIKLENIENNDTNKIIINSEHKKDNIEPYKNKIPGIAKVTVQNFGCNHNRSDSESMLGLLTSYGYENVDVIDKCDIIIINSCTVKGPSEIACKNLAELALAKNKYVVVTGCVPQADRKLAWLNNVSVLGVKQIHRIVEVVEMTLEGNRVELFDEDINDEKILPPLSLPKIRKNPLIEIITVSIGCLGNCTYCKTKHSRGTLISYPEEAIIKRIEESIQEGVKQIWLTSEDTGAYGKDISSNLSNLLYKILPLLKPDVMLRIGMTNPPYILDQVEDIAKILNHPNVFEFIHIPVQSGSNNILKSMKRDYKIEEFSLLIDTLEEKVPYITIATDIITGFPSETASDHNKTVNLIKKYKFPIINISKFYPRPGTVAANMKALPNKVSKTRSNEITNIFQEFPYNELFLSKVKKDFKIEKETRYKCKVWFIENSTKSDHTIGHNKQFIKVLVDINDKLIGKSAIVEIIRAHKWHLEGVVIS